MRKKELSGICGCFALLLFAAVAWTAIVPDSGLTKSVSNLIQPSDFSYVGAFRLPDYGERPLTFEYGGGAMTFNPAGDPSGSDDGFPGSLFIMGHNRMPYNELPNGNQVAEVNIPVPTIQSQVGNLNQASFIQEFQNVASGFFVDLDEIPRVGMAYLNHQATGPRIHLSWGQHFQETESASHAWFSPTLSTPNVKGTWFIGNQSLYSVNDYLFEIPASWADDHVGGRYLATGRFRDGGWSGMGPALFAYCPWIDSSGAPAPSGTRLQEKTLLLYENSYNTENIEKSLQGYQHPDEWSGGEWITTSSGKTGVLFAGAKGIGAKYWYGYINPLGSQYPCVDAAFVGQFPVCRLANGQPCPQSDLIECTNHTSERGWWSNRWDARMILYDPADLAKVAAGELNSWEPQPYSYLSIHDRLFLNPSGIDPDALGSGEQRRSVIGDVAFDRAHGLLYVLELFADQAKPVVHVWLVRPTPTPTPIIGSNSIDAIDVVKITDMSGTLPDGGGAITVRAWDKDGKQLTAAEYAPPLSIINHGTTSIRGEDLNGGFPNGIPAAYTFSVESSKMFIANINNSIDGAVKVPIIYSTGLSNFVSNSIGSRNTLKVTDMSGAIVSGGVTITVTAWDASGKAIPESTSAVPLKLYSHGTTTIAGSTLSARFPSGAPMTYEFTIASPKLVISNVKNSIDGTLNIPTVYTIGINSFVSNSIGSRNTIYISDFSGTLDIGGAAISVRAWDVSGTEILESGSAVPLKLYSYGTTSISGSNLAARFPSGSPMTYEFTVGSSKVEITSVKSNSDGAINIPTVYTSGITNYTTNYVSDLNTIQITDMSGGIPSAGASITISARNADGNMVPESGGAPALKLYNHGTTTIDGGGLRNRFPGGVPVTYEFFIGSSSAIITSLTTSVDGTIKIPTVFTIGPYGGI
jgi:hypothetical protein